MWAWFQELSDDRTYGSHGPNPITNADIRAWCELSRRPITPTEVQTLKLLDKVERNTIIKRMNRHG